MSPILDDERMTLTEVAKRLKVHVATVWRWYLRGVRGRRLRTVLIGGRRWVLTRDLEAFLAGAESAPRSAGDSLVRATIAESVLDSMGVKPQ